MKFIVRIDICITNSGEVDFIQENYATTSEYHKQTQTTKWIRT